MRPRARDVIGALILSAILVALIVWVVVLGAEGLALVGRPIV